MAPFCQFEFIRLRVTHRETLGLGMLVIPILLITRLPNVVFMVAKGIQKLVLSTVYAC